MTLYTVRFCDKEFVAHNLRDFAKIAVFAKWYLRSQSLSDPMQCSIHSTSNSNITIPKVVARPEEPYKFRVPQRSPRTAIMRKAVRSFLYNLFT